MSKLTKSALETRIRVLEGALDTLLASHKDYTQQFPGFDPRQVNHDWARDIERDVEAVRHGRESGGWKIGALARACT